MSKCEGQCTRFFGDCARKPCVVRDGKHYCWQHDPERLEAIRAEAYAKRRAETVKRDNRIEAEAERRCLLRDSGVNKLSDDDLRTIIALGGIHAVLTVAVSADPRP